METIEHILGNKAMNMSPTKLLLSWSLFSNDEESNP